MGVVVDFGCLFELDGGVDGTVVIVVIDRYDVLINERVDTPFELFA